MEAAMAERNMIVSDLRAALTNGDIQPRFEPRVDLGNARLTGFEVLAHWDHPIPGR